MAEPSEKSLAIGMFLEEFSGRTSSISDNKCVPEPFGCGRSVTLDEMEDWDSLTKREYTISGLCNICQDAVFDRDDAA